MSGARWLAALIPLLAGPAAPAESGPPRPAQLARRAVEELWRPGESLVTDLTVETSAGDDRIRTAVTLLRDSRGRFLFYQHLPKESRGEMLILRTRGGLLGWLSHPAIAEVERLSALDGGTGLFGTDLELGEISGVSLESWSFRIHGEETGPEGRACWSVFAKPPGAENLRWEALLDKETTFPLRLIRRRDARVERSWTAAGFEVDEAGHPWASRWTIDDVHRDLRTVVEVKRPRGGVHLPAALFDPERGVRPPRELVHD